MQYLDKVEGFLYLILAITSILQLFLIDILLKGT